MQEQQEGQARHRQVASSTSCSDPAGWLTCAQVLTSIFTLHGTRWVAVDHVLCTAVQNTCECRAEPGICFRVYVPLSRVMASPAATCGVHAYRLYSSTIPVRENAPVVLLFSLQSRARTCLHGSPACVLQRAVCWLLSHTVRTVACA